MKKTLLAIIFAVSAVGCSNEPAKIGSADSATTAAGGGLSKLPSPPEDISDNTNVPERDLSVYQPGVFKVPKNTARTTTLKRKAAAKPKVVSAPKKKAVVTKVAKSKKASKPVAKKVKAKSKTTKKVTSKKTSKAKTKAKHH